MTPVPPGRCFEVVAQQAPAVLLDYSEEEEQDRDLAGAKDPLVAGVSLGGGFPRLEDLAYGG